MSKAKKNDIKTEADPKTKKSKKSQKNAAKRAAKLRKKRRKGFLVFLCCLVVLAALTYGVKFFVFETAKVKTDALMPKYRAGDTVIISKLIDINKIGRGDLVYASFSSATGGKLIRVVAGVEDDEIILREDGNKYLVPGDGSEEINLGEAEGLAGGIIQKDQYLLLCENLDAPGTLDGRNLGLVTSESFIGAPKTIIWPPARMFK